MIINHFPNSSFEDRLNAYLRIYEIVVTGGRYYERESHSKPESIATGKSEIPVLEPAGE